MSTNLFATPTLLLTKLRKPNVADTWIERPRLLRALEAGLSRKLILVDAPAGYGKTTLVSQWLKTRPCCSAWLSLDEADNDPAIFLSYVAQAVRTVYADSMQTTAMLLSGAQLPSPDELTTVLINEFDALSGELILVLDDFHLVQSPQIAQLVSRLVMHSPSNLHLVLVTRSDPALPLAKLRGQDELLEIRSADLRFSPDEARAFIQCAVGHPLDEEAIHMLEEQTEGWPAGLRLAAISLMASDDPQTFIRAFASHGNLHIIEYLAEEVLALQSAPIQDFLLRAALLDRFCAPLCDALRDRESNNFRDSRTLLDEIRRQNLFLIPLDSNGEWFRFHHLFRSFLRQKLRTRFDPQAIACLHGRASDWLAAHGRLEEALQQAQAAGDMNRVARLVEDSARELLNREEILTLQRYLTLVPDEILWHRPRLLLAHAYLKILHHETADVVPLADQAERLLQEGSPDLTPAERDAVMGSILAVRARAALDAGMEPTKCITLAEAALRRLPEAHYYARGTALTPLSLGLYMAGRGSEADLLLQQEAAQSRTSNSFTLRILHNQWIIAFLNGEMAQAIAIAERQVAASEAAGLMVKVGWGHIMLGWSRYSLNDLDGAIEHLEVVVAYGQRVGLRCQLYAQTQLALAYEAIGRSDLANATLDALRAQACSMHSTDVRARIEATVARLHLLRGQVASAMRWVRSSLPQRNPAALLFNDIPDLTRAGILIAHRSPDALAEAQAHLHDLRNAAEARHYQFQLAKILAVQASLLWVSDRHDEALQTMADAAKIGQRGGIIRAFADLGADVRQVLCALKEHAAGYAVQDPYLSAALGAFDKPPASAIPTDFAVLPQLTRREIDVLKLLNKRHTDKEIAQALVISRLTVAKHTANLYRKLGVSSRHEAVVKARALGILNS